MSERIEINWNNETTISNQYFPADKLERAKYAEFLTKFLSSQGFDNVRDKEKQKRNYVLNLNSEWGSGKTYFLKRWADDLKEHYPVVYVDAWEKDYSEDPLMTVVSAIIKSLREQAGRDEDKFTVPTKLIGLFKAAAPGIARGMSKRFFGIDPVAIMEAGETENGGVESIGKNAGENQDVDMSVAAAGAVSHLIKEHEAKSEAITNLKTNVSDWVKAVTDLKPVSLPAFIFIDELDRCRPSYAVEMLETIKHIFDIPGVVFVVATDTEQLQHAVKAVYGEGFDARIYLGRFFNSRFSLKAPELENFLDAHGDIYKLSGSYLEDLGIELLPYNSDGKDTLRNISVVLNAFQVSARTAIQIADRLIATIAHMPRNSCVDVLMLTTLHCLKEKDNELFEEVVAGDFTRKETLAGGKTQDTYLNEFFDINLPVKNGEVSMDFDPIVLVKDLETGPSSRCANPYPNGKYKFSLLEYLKKIFAVHFESISAGSFMLWDFKEDELTPLEQAARELVKHCSEKRHIEGAINGNDASILWLKYIYLEKGYSSIDKDEYRDLVELASAFDWMGKNEL